MWNVAILIFESIDKTDAIFVRSVQIHLSLLFFHAVIDVVAVNVISIAAVEILTPLADHSDVVVVIFNV